jgi:hypothetical protein
MLAACGGDSSTGPKAPVLTAAEAQAIAVAIFEEIERAVGDATLSGQTAELAVVATSREAYSGPCLKGGKISGDVSFVEDLNAAGSGTATSTITAKPQACMISTGSRVIPVDGDLTYRMSFTFAQFEPVGDFTFTGKGTLRWDGGSCVVDYGARFTETSMSLTGSICGESVSGSINFTQRRQFGRPMAVVP